MVDMVATRNLKYGTRRLMAGDPFEARHDRDARLLVGIGKARYATKVAVASDKPVVSRPLATPQAPAAVEADERPALRAEYETKLGKKPFGGWSADVLREKIAAAGEDDA
ncbi:hypothetical protein [Sphingopyxis sp. 550A]|jgi:hypothetical protein